MNQIDSLKKQIQKAEVIFLESQENLKKNPDDYSARLLLMSTENYLGDLFRKLEDAIVRKKEGEGDVKPSKGS